MVRFQGATVYNLSFHGIGRPKRELEPGEANYWIDQDLYARVLDLVITRDDVRLSFDDGNLSDLTIGLPALLDRGLRADFFVIASRLRTAGSLDDNDVRELAASGMGIGSHGMYHRSWRDAHGSLLEKELGEARQVLSDVVGSEVDAAACPLGEYDRRVLRELRRRGYRRVMTSDRAAARADAWLQPRFSVCADDSLASIEAVLDCGVRTSQRLSSGARIMLKSMR